MSAPAPVHAGAISPPPQPAEEGRGAGPRRTWHPDPEERRRRLIAAEVALRQAGEVMDRTGARMSRWASYRPLGPGYLRGWGGLWRSFPRLIDENGDAVAAYRRAWDRLLTLESLALDAEESEFAACVVSRH